MIVPRGPENRNTMTLTRDEIDLALRHLSAGGDLEIEDMPAELAGRLVDRFANYPAPDRISWLIANRQEVVSRLEQMRTASSE